MEGSNRSSADQSDVPAGRVSDERYSRQVLFAPIGKAGQARLGAAEALDLRRGSGLLRADHEHPAGGDGLPGLRVPKGADWPGRDL